MPATTNSRLGGWLGLLLVGWLTGAFTVQGQQDGLQGPDPLTLRSNVLRVMRITREAARTNTSQAAQIDLARAAFALGELAGDNSEREGIAQEGIEAARRALAETNSAAGNYYLALNLGELARTRSVTALALVRQMEQHLKDAIRQDPVYDHAGPHRFLGQLYFDAPGWPVSVGSKANARSEIGKAVALDPDYPENPLLEVEALVRWGETEEACQKLKSLEALVSKVQSRHATNMGGQVVADWRARMAELRQKLTPSTNP